MVYCPEVHPPAAFDRWLAALEARHLARLRFAEVARALRALSATYVERRARLAARGALDTAGKRAAFALYFGPRHWLLAFALAQRLPDARHPARRLLDLGCGTGAAGAGWAAAMAHPPALAALDAHPWAVAEAAATYRHFGLTARVQRGRADRVAWPRADAIVAAFLANELDDEARARLLDRLEAAAHAGARVLVIEPLARAATPWWAVWERRVIDAGGLSGDARMDVPLPPLTHRLARAAGLEPDGVAGRWTWWPGLAARPLSPPSAPARAGGSAPRARAAPARRPPRPGRTPAPTTPAASEGPAPGAAPRGTTGPR